MSLNPIVDLLVSPSYGTKSALIRWSLIDSKYLDGKFIIQKSPDGFTNWSTIHSAVGIVSHLDTSFVPENIYDTIHYRVILQYGGQRYDSNIIGIFDILAPKEFVKFRRMLEAEVENDRVNRDGITLYVFKPLRDGVLSSNIDSDTMQNIGNSINETSYGQKYVGGFSPPIKIYATGIQLTKQNIQNDVEGFGAKDKPTILIRTIAYPDLLREDLIVNPRTDERYVVNSIESFKFRGIVPFVNNVTLLKLDRTDIRYKVPLTIK